MCNSREGVRKKGCAFDEFRPGCRRAAGASAPSGDASVRAEAPVTAAEDSRREVAALRDRIAALGAAALRIGSSLDLDTVLREIADNARALTGARYAAIATIGDDGAAQDFVTSGMTAAAHRRLVQWSEGPRLFEHFRDLDGPLRIADVPAYVESLGFAADRLPSKTFLGMPMRHRGDHVGNFYLVEKDSGAAFTDDDEEILVLFASQAAMAIANARTYHAERRARADLEALVETSPVGVAVLHVPSGVPVLLNAEARRIVERLRTPGRPVEELLGVLRCRLADGREIALAELPLTRVLGDAKTIRAEEIVLSTPDGRSLATLVNATPIPGEDGGVASVVVTLQDLAPLEALERMRAEFLGMVSHELRLPLTSIKGSTAAVLGAARPFSPAETREFFRIIDGQADRMTGLIADLLDAGRIGAGTLSVAPEPTDPAMLVDEARGAFLAAGGRHALAVDLPSNLPRVMADRQRIAQVLDNLLANAARNAPGAAPIRIAAELDGVHVALSVADEGQGIPPERLARLFRRYPAAIGPAGDDPGGAGLGLAICRGLVEAHGGRIRAESAGAGMGARFTFTLPLAADARVEGPADGRARTPGGPRGPDPVLVVDDDPQTLRYVRETLAEAGYAPVVTGDHRELGGMIRRERPALVLLDLVLPGADGIELMQRVPELADVPVIFISAYGRDETIARALEAGAADYVVKPFSPTELIARIRAALRGREHPEPFALGALAIDFDRRAASVGGRPVALTATEFDLLRALALGAGRVLSFDTLLRQVWGGRPDADPKIVRAFVKQLRRKLGDDAARPSWIFNVRGVGYRMPAPDETPGP